MNQKRRFDLSISNTGRQAGGRRVFLAPVGRLLVMVSLVVLTVATSVPAGVAVAAPSDDDPAGGAWSLDPSAYYATGDAPGALVSLDKRGALASKARSGDGGKPSAWSLDPGEYYATGDAPGALASLDGFGALASKARSGDDGKPSAWFMDPSEYYATGDAPGALVSLDKFGALASKARSDDDPVGGAWSLAEAEFSASKDSMAGSGGADRSGAGDGASSAWFTDPGEWAVASNSPSTTAGKASVEPADAGADVFDERGANASAWSEVEDGWFNAQSAPQLFTSSAGSGGPSVSCAEMQDDPVFAASSAAEAEYYEYQCSAKGAAQLVGGGGSHRQ